MLKSAGGHNPVYANAKSDEQLKPQNIGKSLAEIVTATTTTTTTTTTTSTTTTTTTTTTTPEPAVTVESVTVGQHGVARSCVRQVTVLFSAETTVQANAFTVQKRGAGFVTVAQSISVVGDKTQAVLTFSGSHVAFASLVNGNYELTVLAAKVAGLAENYVFGNQFADKFFRLLGDFNGDGTVTAGPPGDYNPLFLATYSKTSVEPGYRNDADFDNDGDVDGTDFATYFIPAIGTTRPAF